MSLSHETSRETAFVRLAGAEEEVLSAQVRVTAVTDPSGELAVRFEDPATSPAGLEHGALELRRELAARLPPGLGHRLVTEAGAVEAVVTADHEARKYSRRYVMATWRGSVLGIEDLDSPAPLPAPWTGAIEPGQVDPELPVVLGAGAVLTLVSYALEVSGSHAEVHASSRMKGLTVLDTARSPYPPQHHPFDVRGDLLADRLLLERGEWRDRGDHVGGVVDPIFFLLTRPERALRPLAASSHFNRRNLVIRAAEAAEHRARAVVVDSWRVRLGPRPGVVPVDAELSVVDPENGHLAVSQPVRLDFDPWHVLGRLRGACGPERAAVDEDPIEGDAHGLAPQLAVDVTLGELVSR